MHRGKICDYTKTAAAASPLGPGLAGSYRCALLPLSGLSASFVRLLNECVLPLQSENGGVSNTA